MFGRRSRPRNHPTPPHQTQHPDDVEHDGTDSTDASTIAPGDTTTLEDLPPLRAPGAGQDSGLAAIEAEFHISDADIALLELGALEFAAPLTPIDAALNDGRAELDVLMERLTGELSSRLGTAVRLRPFFMIPERCWEGEHREALVELMQCLPNQTWNILPLAADAATAEALGIIEHPGGASLHAVDAANSFLSDIISKMQRSCEQAAFSSHGIDTDAIARAREDAMSRVEALARHISGMVVGTDAVMSTRAVFFGD